MTNAQFYQAWIDSIIDDNIEKMREYAGDEDFYEGWENGSDFYEINFEIRQTITRDRGDYFTQPSVSVDGLITGTLIIHDADDNETEHYFERTFTEH